MIREETECRHTLDILNFTHCTVLYPVCVSACASVCVCDAMILLEGRMDVWKG